MGQWVSNSNQGVLMLYWKSIYLFCLRYLHFGCLHLRSSYSSIISMFCSIVAQIAFNPPYFVTLKPFEDSTLICWVNLCACLDLMYQFWNQTGSKLSPNETWFRVLRVTTFFSIDIPLKKHRHISPICLDHPSAWRAGRRRRARCP